MLAARDRLAQEAEREFDEVARRGRGAQGRQFLDVGLLRHVLMLRDEKGLSGEEIERRLGLRKGIVARLGAKGGGGECVRWTEGEDDKGAETTGVWVC